MNFVSIITVFTLIIIGLFHFYWAFGGKIGLSKALQFCRINIQGITNKKNIKIRSKIETYQI